MVYEAIDHISRKSSTTPLRARRMKMKLYGLTKYQIVSNTTTSTSELKSHDEALPYSHQHSTESQHRLRAPIARMTVDEQPSGLPPADNPKAAHDLMPSTRCTISKEDLQRAIAVTPVFRRESRGRLAVGLPRRPSRWPARKANRSIQGSVVSAEVQVLSNVTETDEKEEFQSAAESEEIVMLENSRGYTHQVRRQPHEDAGPLAEVLFTSDRSWSQPNNDSQHSQSTEESVVLEKTWGTQQQQIDRSFLSETMSHLEKSIMEAQLQRSKICHSEYSTSRTEKFCATSFQQHLQAFPIIRLKKSVSGAEVTCDQDLSSLLEEGHESDRFTESHDEEQQDDQGQDIREIDEDIVKGKDADVFSNHAQIDEDDPKSRSLKRNRSSPGRHSPDIYDIHYDINMAGDDTVGGLSPKKKRRINRKINQAQGRKEEMQEYSGRTLLKETGRAPMKKKSKHKKSPQRDKQPRDVPVDGLVIVSERLDSSGGNESSREPAELPEDPISQLTASQGNSHAVANGKLSVHQLKINSRPKFEFGAIDISDFRIPKMRYEKYRVRHDHSDGFVGLEAEPIRRTMSVKKRNRPRRMYNRIALRMGQLTLVKDRNEDVLEQNPTRLWDEGAENPVLSNMAGDSESHPSRADKDAAMHEDDLMKADIADEPPFNGGKVTIDMRKLLHSPGQQYTTPLISPNDTSILGLPSRSSPLQQNGRNRTVSFKKNTVIPTSQPASIQSKVQFGRQGSNEATISQQLKMGSASKWLSKEKTMEIDVPLQLMMVTIPRSYVRDGDSDDSYSGENTEEDCEDSSDSNGHCSDTLEEDSGNSGDDEPEGEAEKDNLGLISRVGIHPCSTTATERSELPRRSMIQDLKISSNNPFVPTLRREDAQKSLLGMSTSSRIKAPAGRRRSSRIHLQQEIRLEKSMSNCIDKMDMSMIKPREDARCYRRLKSTPAQPNRYGDSWTPREPVDGGEVMEMSNNDIIDDACPMPHSGRMLPSIASKALQTSETTPANSQLSQGFVELGNTKVSLQGSLQGFMLETQVLNSSQDCGPGVEMADDEDHFVTESSYFQRASQQLQRIQAGVPRTKSLPALMHTPQVEETVTAGGITMMAMFQQTMSPLNRPKSIPGTCLTATPETEKSLKDLTRRASIGLGTIPSGRKRLVSLPFQPPFKRQ